MGWFLQTPATGLAEHNESLAPTSPLNHTCYSWNDVGDDEAAMESAHKALLLAKTTTSTSSLLLTGQQTLKRIAKVGMTAFADALATFVLATCSTAAAGYPAGYPIGALLWFPDAMVLFEVKYDRRG